MKGINGERLLEKADEVAGELGLSRSTPGFVKQLAFVQVPFKQISIVHDRILSTTLCLPLHQPSGGVWVTAMMSPTWKLNSASMFRQTSVLIFCLIASIRTTSRLIIVKGFDCKQTKISIVYHVKISRTRCNTPSVLQNGERQRSTWSNLGPHSQKRTGSPVVEYCPVGGVSAGGAGGTGLGDLLIGEGLGALLN